MKHKILTVLLCLLFLNRKTKVWNQVKVEYVGFDGLFDLDVLEDEILEN